MELLSHLDIDILSYIHHNRIIDLDPMLIGITNTVSYISIVLLLFLFIKSFLFNDTAMRLKGWTVLISYTTAACFSTVIKYSIDRQRPFVTYHFIEKLSTGGSPSFPSGHTTEAFAIATAICLCYPRWYLVMIFYGWALIVAYSRISLGVHYPSDVLAGMLVGLISSTLCFYFINKRNQWINHVGISK